METTKLKEIVDHLTDDVTAFVDEYIKFQEETEMELNEEHDKFMDGVNKCYESLATLIGTIEVENIKRK